MIFMVNLTKESADKISPYATEVAAVWMKTRLQRCHSERSNRNKPMTHHLYNLQVEPIFKKWFASILHSKETDSDTLCYFYIL
jgi:hypothetical protein